MASCSCPCILSNNSNIFSLMDALPLEFPTFPLTMNRRCALLFHCLSAPSVLSSSATLAAIDGDGSLDLVLHAGDLSYADCDQVGPR